MIIGIALKYLVIGLFLAGIYVFFGDHRDLRAETIGTNKLFISIVSIGYIILLWPIILYFFIKDLNEN